MIDKNYCMSSYLALRCIERDDVDFYPELHHESIYRTPDTEQIKVASSEDIDRELKKQFEPFKNARKGVMLSGGMDSAIVASYMNGSDAYTFRFLGGNFQTEELRRAEHYAERYGLRLHYVDIDWKTVENYLDPIMRCKAAPVHSIEPQIMQAALQAKSDSVEVMFIGDGSDYIFGGMDKLLAQDWTFDAFMERYIFTNPSAVLKQPVSMQYIFERYRTGKDGIDYLAFFREVCTAESFASYANAFQAAEMPFYDPYAKLEMSSPLDLHRIRNGEPKYLVRELMAKKYPEIPVPNKNPMPRPVDVYFKDWKGPVRPEFRTDLDMSQFSGNQKWQLYCLERFLNLFEPLK